MDQPNAVEIVEDSVVAPPPAATPDQSSTTPSNPLPLTFFDMYLIQIKEPPIQRVYFYQTPEATSSLFFDSIVPRLKHSLSLTLHHFLPLAGKLTWPPTSRRPLVVYAQGDPVSVTVAQSNANFNRLISVGGNAVTEIRDVKECHPLLPKLLVSHERAKLLAIQITAFPDFSGFSIGIVANHMVADGKSTNLFLKSWSHICRSYTPSCGGDESDYAPLPPELKAFYNRTLIKEPTKLEAIFSSNQSLNASVLPSDPKPEPDSVRGTFRFSRAKIDKLRKLILMANKDKDGHDRHLSTYSLTSAYALICLAQAEENKDDKVVFSFVVDCRSRLDPPLPPSYFGNCIGIKSVELEREVLLGKQGFFVAVNAINEATTSLATDISPVLNRTKNRASTLLTSSEVKYNSQYRREYLATGSHRFNVYSSSDFGWGKPMKVDILGRQRTGALRFADSRDGDGGVEIVLILKKHHMDAFASLFVQGLKEEQTILEQ